MWFRSGFEGEEDGDGPWDGLRPRGRRRSGVQEEEYGAAALDLRGEEKGEGGRGSEERNLRTAPPLCAAAVHGERRRRQVVARVGRG